MSDLLWTAITGAGIVKRELYTDDDDIINEARHCLGLTGINLVATKSDLIDRGLIIEHKVISEREKKREEVLYSSFHEMRPGLLGYIIDNLVKILKWKKEHPQGLQRNPQLLEVFIG